MTTVKLPKALEEKIGEASAKRQTDRTDFCGVDMAEHVNFKAGADWMAAQLLPKLAELERALKMYAMTNETFPEYGDVARSALEKLKEWRGGE